MNKTQKIIIAVLILAILFSSLSIFISFSAMKLYYPQKDISGRAVSSGNAGGIQLVVESSTNSKGAIGQ